MKVVRFDRSEAFLNEELAELVKSVDDNLDDNPVVAYAFCAIFEDGVDMRSWSALGGVHDLALVGSLASLQQQIVEDRNSTEHEGPDPED